MLSSGQLASFDRRKCKGPLNGPTRDRTALPRRLDALSVARSELQGRRRDRRAPIAYYNFVDQFDMLGVGKDVPIATGN